MPQRYQQDKKMMTFPRVTLAVLALSLTACASPPSTDRRSTTAPNAQADAPPDSIPAIRDRARAIASSPEALTAFLQDTTAKRYDRQHGTQYSYFEANGRYNLVYPGNFSVLKGRWEVREGGRYGLEICYSYDVATHNPVTRRAADIGDWICHIATSSLAQWSEIRDGDPLNLAATTVLPIRLPKGINLSIPTAAKSVGLSTNMSANKSPNPDRAADARVGQ